MNIVVVSPHREDAALSVGLAVHGWLGAGHRVTVLNCFTQSGYAPYSDVESVHAHDRVSFVTALRRREDQAWNKLLGGRLRFHDLDLLDAPLRLGCAVEEVEAVTIRAGDRAIARLRGAVVKLMRAIKAGDAACIAPLAVGAHIDHRIARQAVLDALAESAFPVALYEDLPYAARPGALDTVPTLAGEVGLELEPVFAAPFADDPPRAVDQKSRWAECYDSQIDSEVVRSLAAFSLRYHGRERLWADSAWRRSGLSVLDEVAA